jgi:hypothetical protein
MKRGSSLTSKQMTSTPYSSYQQGGSYQPPVHYAADQTKSLQDTTTTFYQADETAAKILEQMQAQRGQIQNAQGDVQVTREATDKAKREMIELQYKYREKKQRLYLMIGLLSLTDFLLFCRILQCHGNFYCLK